MNPIFFEKKSEKLGKNLISLINPFLGGPPPGGWTSGQRVLRDAQLFKASLEVGVLGAEDQRQELCARNAVLQLQGMVATPHGVLPRDSH